MILSCDPGLSGAFALLDGAKLMSIYDMPTFTRLVNRKKRRAIDEEATIELIRRLDILNSIDALVVEKVHGMPGQSAAGSFSFGYVYGVITTAARCCGIPIVEVSPMTWKGKLHVPKEKNEARKRASELFQGCAKFWPLKKHDGRAEAAMIGLYGTSLFNREEKNYGKVEYAL